MKVSVYIATSLDGFIARPDGDIDWLMAADTSEGSEDFGFQTFMDSADYLIMGRNSLEKVMSFSEWPYSVPVIVLSETLKAVPAEVEGKVTLYSGSIEELVKQLENEGCSRLYIDGGKVIRSFLNEGLITDITITKIPVLLGEGLPLFGKTTGDIQLKHTATKAFKNGFVQSSYDVINEI